MEILFVILGTLATCILGIIIYYLFDLGWEEPTKPWWMH